MSMLQIDKYLEHCPRVVEVPEQEPAQPAHIHHFVYGYYYHSDYFKSKFPSAELVALGFIRGWTWHLNERGTQHHGLADMC